MCFSILLVSYRADKEVKTIKCADEHDERAKIDEAIAKDQVSKVDVFRAHRNVIKRIVADEIPYTAA